MRENAQKSLGCPGVLAKSSGWCTRVIKWVARATVPKNQDGCLSKAGTFPTERVGTGESMLATG